MLSFIKDNWAIFLFILIISISAVIGNNWYENIISENQKLKTEITKIDKCSSQLLTQLDQYKSQFVHYKKETDLWDDRTRLMAALHNHNWSAVESQKLQELLYISQDWTIDHLPTLLDLSEDDKIFLSKFMNKKVPLYKGKVKHHLPGRN